MTPLSQEYGRGLAQGYRHIKLHETPRRRPRAQDATGAGGAASCSMSIARVAARCPRDGGSLRGDGLLWLEEPVWPPEDVHGWPACAIAASRSQPEKRRRRVWLQITDRGRCHRHAQERHKIGGVGEWCRYSVVQRTASRWRSQPLFRTRLRCPRSCPRTVENR